MEKKDGLRTFKRTSRTKNNTQLEQIPVKVPEPKKRNAEDMEIDVENELTKKARVEVDKDGSEEDADGAGKFPLPSNAGLQGQPGETK